MSDMLICLCLGCIDVLMSVELWQVDSKNIYSIFRRWRIYKYILLRQRNLIELIFTNVLCIEWDLFFDCCQEIVRNECFDICVYPEAVIVVVMASEVAIDRGMITCNSEQNILC